MADPFSDVQIDLRRGNIVVAKQVLKRSNISSCFQ